MSDLSAFFADNAAATEPEEFPVSDRFKDKEGKPLAWKIRSISEEENDAIRTAATRKVKGKGGIMVPETNSGVYLAKLAAACVVYPNLNDADLQNSYGVRGADMLIRKMLLSGEYATLIGKIQEINGFDKDVNELAEDVKN